MATTRRKKKIASRKRWRDFDHEAAQKHHDERQQSRKESSFHDLNQGWNFFFVMPPWSDRGMIWKELQQHDWGVNCPQALSGGEKPCVVCAELRRRMKKGDTDFNDKFRPRSRGLFNAIRKAVIKKATADDVKVLGVSGGVFDDVIEHVTDERVNIANPTAAMVLGIKRTGKGKHDTKYKVKIATDPIDISQYLTDEVLEGLFDLDAIRAARPASTKELRKLMRGGAGDEDDGDDDTWDDDDTGTLDDGDDDFDDSVDEDEEGLEEPEDDEEAPEEEEGEEEEGEEYEEEEEEAPEEEGEEEEEEPPPPRRKKKTTKKKVAKKRTRRRRAS